MNAKTAGSRKDRPNQIRPGHAVRAVPRPYLLQRLLDQCPLQRTFLTDLPLCKCLFATHDVLRTLASAKHRWRFAFVRAAQRACLTFRTEVRALCALTRGVTMWMEARDGVEVLPVSVVSATVVLPAVVVPVVVVVTGDVVPDVMTTQLVAEPLLDVQLTVVPLLTVLLVQTGAEPSLAVQLPLEPALSVVEPELLLLDVQVVVVPLLVVLTVHPAGTAATLGEGPELLDDEPPLLELHEPPPLELDELPPLELYEEWLELLVEPDALTLDATPVSARTDRMGEAGATPADAPTAPRRSTASGSPTRRTGISLSRSRTWHLDSE